MPAKKLKNVTAQVHLVDKHGKYTGRGTKRHIIFRYSENHGVIINDGREVHKDKEGKWCYEPK